MGLGVLGGLVGGVGGAVLGSAFGGGNDNSGPVGRHISLGSDPARLQTAYNLAVRLGHQPLADKILKRQGHLGLTNDPSAGQDFNSSTFDQAAAMGARRPFSQRRIAAGRGPAHAGAFSKQLDVLREQNTMRENQDYYDQNVEPAFSSAQNSIQDLVDHPTFAASDIAARRSQIASTIKGGLESNLRTTGAALGIRGMDGNSAAGAAVLARMQESADKDLADSLSGFGLQVNQLERTNKAQNVGLLADLATKRMAAHAAIKDPSVLFGLNDQISGLMESIRAQKSAEEYQRGLARNASGRDWLGTGISAVGALAAPFTGGLSLAAAGGVNAARNLSDGSSAGIQPWQYANGDSIDEG